MFHQCVMATFQVYYNLKCEMLSICFLLNSDVHWHSFKVFVRKFNVVIPNEMIMTEINDFKLYRMEYLTVSNTREKKKTLNRRNK